MTKAQVELEFDPNAMAVDDSIDAVDLGDHEFEVDMLEAQAAEEGADEDESTDEETDDDVSEDAEPKPDAEEEDAGDEEEDESDGEAEGAEEGEHSADAPTEEDTLANQAENPLIPRERLNQANRKRQEEADRADEALARVAELEATMAAETAKAGITGVDPAVMKEAAEKFLDGDAEAFTTVIADQMNNMRESMTANQEALMEQAVQTATRNIQEGNRQVERNDAADHWMGIYPELDHTNPDTLNQEALSEAISLGTSLEEKGYAPKVAMERAVKATAAMYDLKSVAKPEGKETAAKTPAAPKVKKVAKKIKQPAATGTGDSQEGGAAKVDPEKMTQDEWDALPDSVREGILTG